MTDYPNIVLIGGCGSGKSTVAKFLHELGYSRLAFAGVAEHPHKGSPRHLVTDVWGPEAVNDRVKLIAMAEAGRAVDPDAWLNALLRDLDRTDGPVAVDDARYANEFYGLRGRGFVSVRVTAPDPLREARLRANGKWLDGYFDHAIEHHLDDVPADHTIVNDGTQGELIDDVVRVLNRERRHR